MKKHYTSALEKLRNEDLKRKMAEFREKCRNKTMILEIRSKLEQHVVASKHNCQYFDKVEEVEIEHFNQRKMQKRKNISGKVVYKLSESEPNIYNNPTRRNGN